VKREAVRVAVGVLAVAGAVAVVLYGSLRAEVSQWKYADEARAAPAGQRLNVGGYVRTLVVDRGSLTYEFEIETRPPRPPATVKARYHGIVPDTFKLGAEVVAVGRFNNDHLLQAESIMAKCPSKY
jgi:cytochrome c-type biogenesis protein CcmE